MDTALIVIGVILAGILITWIFTVLSDPKDIGEAEEAQVRDETPNKSELERSKFNEAGKNADSNAEDIAFYSPGESDND